MLYKEFDRLFRIQNDYSLKTDLNAINIEKDSFIFIEVKNNVNLELIKKNILYKKNLLLKLGIEYNKVYFFEVINSEPNFKNNDTIRKLVNQKIIILFPKDLNFLEQKVKEKIALNSENKNAFFEEFEIRIQKNFEELKKMIKENL